MTRITAGVYYHTRESPQTPLPVLASRLRTEVVDLTASHTLTQIFCNPPLRSPTKGKYAAHIREAKYTFPLYESCAVSAFSAQIGSKSITGVVKPTEEAKAAYEAAKAAGEQAALLEQNTGEVFTTSIGNILPGEFVFVVIKYVHELKHDTEVEGVRLVVPTIIAPKYGWTDFDSTSYTAGWEKGWNAMSQKIEEAAGGRPGTPGLAIEVVATMNGSIRGIQSPSHPISVNIGSHDASGQGEFNSKMARATLAIASTSTTGLDKDFSLVINSTDVSLPRAFLAPHPSLPSTSTLLVTLAPRFELPQQHPEVVFIVDRSGSMHDKISTVRSALHLFLASLPVGTFFNIISFGGHHSSLWPTSQSYNAQTLEAAKRHVDTMEADMGGTEMFGPCKAAVENRRADLKLEVLVLTDGEIWRPGLLFEYINNATSSGDARFFSLGVGGSVSHLLVEGISRAGKGYSQIVGEGENMQKKIMRMLKAALTPHVNDWSVDWDGKSAIMNSFKDAQRKAEMPVVHAPISLFDPSCNPDNTTSTPPLPTRPPILQTPATIPPLYPFTRTTLYFLLTDPCTPPTTINLVGNAYDSNTNSIHPLTLTIPITPITCPTTSLGLYSLFGRKLLQDLEEGRCGYLPPSSSLTDAEGTRLGVMFGLASKWTSFVAVATGGEDRVSADKTPLSDWEVVGTGLEGIDDYEDGDTGMSYHDSLGFCSGGSASTYSPPLTRSLRGTSAYAITMTMPSATGAAPRQKGSATSYTSSTELPAGGSAIIGTFGVPSIQQQQQQQQQTFSLFGRGSGGSSRSYRAGSLTRKAESVVQSPPAPSRGRGYVRGSLGSPATTYVQECSSLSSPATYAEECCLSSPATIVEECSSLSSPTSRREIDSLDFVSSPPPPSPADTTPSGLITNISHLQLFSGHFPHSAELLQTLGLSGFVVDGAKQRLGITAGDTKMETALVTCMVLVWLRKQLKEHQEEWELIAEKARLCVESDVGKVVVARMEKEVESLF